MSASIEPALAAFVETCVKDGLYSSKSETINAAVRMLCKSEKARIAKSPDAQIKRALRMTDTQRRR